MKALLAFGAVLACSHAFASADGAPFASSCLGAAQFQGIVKEVIALTDSQCRVTVSYQGLRSYTVDPHCPLDLPELNQIGITLPLKAPGVCAREAGEEISGVAVLTEAGEIIL